MSFKPFFRKVYCHLFPGCKLAETPKPWRINLILEIVYGGWTLIRERVASLVCLSCTNHWAKKYSELYDHFCKWPTVFDEYPVENTHQAQTKPSDTAEKFTNRTKSIFESKQRQANFRSIFTPPKQFNFSQQQLQFRNVHNS